MRRSHLRAAHTLAACLVLSSCGSSLQAPGDGPNGNVTPVVARDTAALFQTDSLAYTLRTGDLVAGVINVTLTNRTAGPIYIVNCNGHTGVSLERRVNGQWQSVWSPAIPLCLSTPIVVPVGGSLQRRVGIQPTRVGTNDFPEWPARTIAGEYRLVWPSVLSSLVGQGPFGDPLPLEARVSNRFTLSAQAP
jgi:hypothetical protein